MKRFLCLLLLLMALSGCAGGRLPDGTQAQLPILMCHHVADTGDGSVTVSEARFEEHLAWLAAEGWVSVDADALIAFVQDGEPLPDKAVFIVFDDGYESNLTRALPLLERYDARAAICVIGCSIGKDTYKDTSYTMHPHFGWDGARALLASGRITIGHHTWDMHAHLPYEADPDTARPDVLKKENESEEAYRAALTADYNRLADEMERELGFRPTVFAYPGGRYDALAESVIREAGALITLTTDVGMNTLTVGDEDSLHLLKRWNINDETDLAALEAYLRGENPEEGNK